MSVNQRFRAAVLEGAVGSYEDDLLLPAVWARACVTVLPIQGASLSLRDDLLRMPVGASDDQASAAEMLQFTHGDGPCLEVYETGRATSVSTIEMEQRWPVFGAALTSTTTYRAVASVPLVAAEKLIGALDLYSGDDAGLGDVGLDDAVAVAAVIVQMMSSADQTPVWDELIQQMSTAPLWLHDRTARRRSRGWIAIGILRAANDFDASEALDVIRAYAWSHDTTFDAVAGRMVDRTLSSEQLLRS